MGSVVDLAWSSGVQIPGSRLRCPCVLQPCYSLVQILGSRVRCLCVLQPCYSLVLRRSDPGITGEVPVCATALLQPGPQAFRSRDHG